MADTNEAQLLSELLRDIAREDAHVDAAHLEARVMEAVDASAAARSMQPSVGSTGMMRWAIAAAAAIAVLVPAVFWPKQDVPVENGRAQETRTQGPADAEGPAKADGPAKEDGPAKAGHYISPRTRRNVNLATIQSTAIAPPVAESPIAQLPVAQSRIAELPITQIPIAQSYDEFVPLMPMTEQELTGPFQVVRVQMPRASLGALRSPLEHPNELIEADVLLSEDGMARAIRVSTSGSVYPWRPR